MGSESHNWTDIKTRLADKLRSVAMKQGLILGMSMLLAGVLDYGVNVIAGRWLEPVEYGVFISVTAILQAMLLPAIAIRVVVAFYTVKMSVRGDSGGLGAFVIRVWRWAWQYGTMAALVLAVLSPLLARVLHISTSLPLWAASLMVLMLVLRESTFGTLQGIQAFTGLGVVQIIQALLRLLFAIGLIAIGWRASGAILAQPLGCGLGLGLALWWLRPYLAHRSRVHTGEVNWHFSTYTFLGLGVFGVMTNLDAVFVKHYFSPQIAGNYGPVVTLAKVSLFLPWAIGMILLPKVMKRQAAGRDARPLLLVALLAALAPGLGVTALYFVSPGILVKVLFTGAYSSPGIVLGLASLAASLYSALYIWLNYALSLERPAFVYALIGVLLWQGLGMFVFGRENLVNMALAMVSAGIIGNLAGFVTTWSLAPRTKPVEAQVAGP